jgi:hypothetical protein
MTQPPRWTRRPEGSTWGDFGADDTWGRLNLLGPDQVRKGVAEVRDGRTFCLVRLPLRTGATFVHDWFALGLGLLVPGHVYFALKDRQALREMRTGRSNPVETCRRTLPGAHAQRSGRHGAGDLQRVPPAFIALDKLEATVVRGRSNQGIALTLVVAPRTVAPHVEHVLVKLEAPTRTLASVRAEREGLYVPAVPAAPPYQLPRPPRAPARVRTAAAAEAAPQPDVRLSDRRVDRTGVHAGCPSAPMPAPRPASGTYRSRSEGQLTRIAGLPFSSVTASPPRGVDSRTP